MIDAKVYAYVALGLLAIYVGLRLFGQWTINKLVRAEFEHVLNHDEHKIKGKFE